MRAPAMLDQKRALGVTFSVRPDLLVLWQSTGYVPGAAIELTMNLKERCHDAHSPPHWSGVSPLHA